MQDRHNPYVNLYLCNPGPYTLNLQMDINLHVQSNYAGMPQQQQLHFHPPPVYGHFYNQPQLDYGRMNPSSTSSEYEYSTSGSRTPAGVKSDSWNYASPSNATFNVNPPVGESQGYRRFSNQGPGNTMVSDASGVDYSTFAGNQGSLATSTPIKKGCFSKCGVM